MIHMEGSMIQGKRWILRMGLLAGFLALCLAGCARPIPSVHWKNPPAEPRPIDKTITEAFRKHGLAGLSIAVVKEGKILWAAGYGYSNLETESKVGPSTRFHAGRLSSLIMVAAAKHLVETTDVSLEDFITDLLPGTSLHSPFEENPTITLGQVIQHRAGLPSRESDPIATVLHPIFPAGTVRFYSHLGMSIVEKLIDIRCGQTLETYSKENLLTLLGMWDSSFMPAGNAKGRTRYYNEDEERLKDGKCEEIPSVGLRTSAMDLANFLAYAMKPGPDGRPSVVDLAGICTHQEIDPRCAMLAVDDSGSGAIALVPEQQLAAVVLSNTMNQDAGMVHLAWQVLAEEAKKGGFSLPAPITCTQEDASLPEKVYDGYMVVPFGLTKLETGEKDILASHVWASDADHPVIIGWDVIQALMSDRDLVSLGLKPFRFVPCDGRSCYRVEMASYWFPEELTAQARIIWDSSSNPQFMEISMEGAVSLLGIRLADAERIRSWARYAGDYQLEGESLTKDSAEEIRLIETHSGLLLWVPKDIEKIPLYPMMFSLIPLSDHDAMMLFPFDGLHHLGLMWVGMDTSKPGQPVFILAGERFRRVKDLSQDQGKTSPK